METPKSQTPQTARLGRKIRRAREKKKLPWKTVCALLNILKADGSPNPGAAHKIGYKNYEPSGRVVRQRYGLQDICLKCKRPFRIPRQTPAPVKSPARAWWDKLKPGVKEKLIELSYKDYLNWKKEKNHV